jgi:hypothetical protein
MPPPDGELGEEDVEDAQAADHEPLHERADVDDGEIN